MRVSAFLLALAAMILVLSPYEIEARKRRLPPPSHCMAKCKDQPKCGSVMSCMKRECIPCKDTITTAEFRGCLVTNVATCGELIGTTCRPTGGCRGCINDCKREGRECIRTNCQDQCRPKGARGREQRLAAFFQAECKTCRVDSCGYSDSDKMPPMMSAGAVEGDYPD